MLMTMGITVLAIKGGVGKSSVAVGSSNEGLDSYLVEHNG